MKHIDYNLTDYLASYFDKLKFRMLGNKTNYKKANEILINIGKEVIELNKCLPMALPKDF
jgi:hypothetical protein